jgi:hypothetical protein
MMILCSAKRPRINGGFAPEHTSGQWRHYVDSSKFSLKEMLLHNGNKFLSIPPDGAVHTNETYENL